MTALQRLLERMPDDGHRQSFLRIVAEAGVREDSPDMVFLALDHEARWSTVLAMSSERERVESMLTTLPDALRAAGAEIVRGLATDIASQSVAAITEAVEGEVGQILRAQHAQSTSAIDALTKQSERATRAITSTATKSIGELEISARRGVEEIYSARVGLPAMLPALMVIVAIIGVLVFGAWQMSAKQSFSHGYEAGVRQHR